MGWANCGTDSKNRPIGYVHEAICDHPGCEERIDRGLAYACGLMHGEDDEMGWCEDYFCGKHRVYTTHSLHNESYTVCKKCFESGIKDGTFIDQFFGEEQANDRE